MGNSASTSAKALRTQRLFGSSHTRPCNDESDAVIDEEAADLGVDQQVVRDVLDVCLQGRGCVTPYDADDACVTVRHEPCAIEEMRPFEWRGVRAETDQTGVTSHWVGDITIRATPRECSLARPPCPLRIGDHVAVACATSRGRGAVEHHGVVVATEPVLLLAHSFGPTVDRAVVQLGTWAQFCCGAEPRTALIYHTTVAAGADSATADEPLTPRFSPQEVRARACALLGTAGLHDVVRFNCEHVARFATTGLAFSIQQLTVWQCLQEIVAAEPGSKQPLSSEELRERRRELEDGFRPGRAAVYPPLLGVLRSAVPTVGAMRVAVALLDDEPMTAGTNRTAHRRFHTSPQAMARLAQHLVPGPLFDASGFAAERWFLASPTVKRALVGRRPVAGDADAPLMPPTRAVPSIAMPSATRCASTTGSADLRSLGARRAMAACLAWAGLPPVEAIEAAHFADFEQWAAPVAPRHRCSKEDVSRVLVVSDVHDALPLPRDVIAMPAMADSGSTPQFSAFCTRALLAVPQDARVVTVQFANGAVQLQTSDAPRHLSRGCDDAASAWKVVALARPEPRLGVEVGRHVLGFQWRGHWLAAEIGIADKHDDGELDFVDEFNTAGASMAVLVRVT